jgi:hypothetical protein
MVLSAHVQTPLFIVDCDRIRLVQLSRKMCGLTGASRPPLLSRLETTGPGGTLISGIKPAKHLATSRLWNRAA